MLLEENYFHTKFYNFPQIIQKEVAKLFTLQMHNEDKYKTFSFHYARADAFWYVNLLSRTGIFK